MRIIGTLRLVEMAAFFAIFLVLGVGQVGAQDCRSLTPFECATSLSCTLEAEENSNSGFLCRDARGYCEAGFQQLVMDPANQNEFMFQEVLAGNCEAKDGSG